MLHVTFVIYLLERLRVGLSGVVGHVRDVGLMEVGVKGQRIQGQIGVGVRRVGGVQLCPKQKEASEMYWARSHHPGVVWLATCTPVIS